jgi:hypothetical protein
MNSDKALMVILWKNGKEDAQFSINPAGVFTYNFPPDASFDMLTITPITATPYNDNEDYDD